MSYEAWGEPDDDYASIDALIDAGWMTAEQAEVIAAAGKRWLAARAERFRCHDLKGDLQIQERAAAQDLEDALVEVFGGSPAEIEPLEVAGVSRVADNEQAILVHFRSRPSDDRLRELHDRLRQIEHLERRIGRLLAWKAAAFDHAEDLTSDDPMIRAAAAAWWRQQADAIDKPLSVASSAASQSKGE